MAKRKRKGMRIEDFNDPMRQKRNKEVQEKYDQQCKPSEIKTYTLNPYELEKYTEDEVKVKKIPMMLVKDWGFNINHEFEKRRKYQMSKNKALKVKIMEFEGKNLTYRIQEENIVSIIKGNQGIRVEPKELGTIVEELQELKEVILHE